MAFLDDSGVTRLVRKIKSSLKPLFDSKQDVLISGGNIKTVNYQSLLGGSNIQIDTKFSPTQLWINTNPTANFAAQIVSLDLSKYVWVMIQFKSNKDDDYLQTDIFQVGTTGRLRSTDNAISRRVVIVSSTGIEFNGGYHLAANGTSFTSSNAYCVPYKIYGL